MVIIVNWYLRLRTERSPESLALRLPKLDAIALRVHRPGKPAVGFVFDLVVDRYARLLELRQQLLEMRDAKIHHERSAAGLEVLGARRENRKCRCTNGLGMVLVAPIKRIELRRVFSFARCDQRDSQVGAIPVGQFPWVLRFDEDTAHTGHPGGVFCRARSSR